MGRPKKDVTEAETTLTFDGENAAATELPKPKEAAPRRSSSKKLSMSDSEVASIFHTLIGGIAKTLGYKYNYRESDYNKEAQGLVRLSEKFPVVLRILVMVDPLLIFLALAEKITSIAKTKQTAPKPEPQPAQQEKGPQLVYSTPAGHAAPVSFNGN